MENLLALGAIHAMEDAGTVQTVPEAVIIRPTHVGQVSMKYSGGSLLVVIRPIHESYAGYSGLMIRSKMEIKTPDYIRAYPDVLGIKLGRLWDIVDIWLGYLSKVFPDDMSTVVSKVKMLNDVYMKLHAGEVRFTFKKVNGELREARGTLKDVEHLVKGTATESQRRAGNDCIRYYDLDSQGFRSFRIDRIESVE